MNVFDRLQQRLDLEKKEEGISPLDLASLPPNLRKLMRLMLREVEMFYVDLVKAVDEMPERDRMTHSELDRSLKELTQQGWLIRRGEGDRVNYQVNLRRKAGSKIAQGIWNVLDARIVPSESTEDADKASGEPDKPA